MNKSKSGIPFSLLELATVSQGDLPKDTFIKILDLAKHVKKLATIAFGYQYHLR